MRVKEISLGRSVKRSINYQSYGYDLHATVELCDGDTPDKARKMLDQLLNQMEQAEIDKIKEAVE